jgi:glycosyltransferase involved in cell wall biosynthesis
MSKGCGVICSDACGVSSFLNKYKEAYVFSSNNIVSLKEELIKVFSNGTLNFEKKKKNLNFFDDNLSGKAGAETLMEKLK